MYGFLLAALVFACLGGSAAADEQAAARAVLDKAIKAQGDEAAMAKIVAVYSKIAAVSAGDGPTIRAQMEIYCQGLDKSRLVITDDKGKVVYTEVINGKDGWAKRNQEDARAMGENEVASRHEDTYVGWVTWLMPLRRAEYRLSLLDGTVVAGRKTVGILVRHEKHDAVKLYFDKETYLLAKYERRFMDHEKGREVHAEIVLSDYRTVQGVEQPNKLESYRDEVKQTNVVCQKVELLDKPFDDKLFAKP